MEEMRRCSKCGIPLTIHNPTHICWTCQDKLAKESLRGFDGPNIDVKQIAYILELGEEEVRRLWREGRLPPAISLTRKLQWDKEFFQTWILSQHKVPPALGRQFEAFIKAHGGLHLDDVTGEYRLGKKEDIQVWVYSKDESGRVVGKAKIVSDIIPGHYEQEPG